MPDLIFSPFLPLSQQIEQQQQQTQLTMMDSDMRHPVSNLLGTGVGPDDSLQRLNYDLPPQPLFNEDGMVQADITTSNSAEALKASG